MFFKDLIQKYDIWNFVTRIGSINDKYFVHNQIQFNLIRLQCVSNLFKIHAIK